jgi:DNA-binding Xre family transcriptional regulator
MIPKKENRDKKEKRRGLKLTTIRRMTSTTREKPAITTYTIKKLCDF